ncbi:MAG: hypothetical protein IJ026_01375 [Candidatus Methanomethylophilaceae archaeon]|nr:hypothetical protein [Candidatus Methanomethylophilaceae archaeon]
MNYREIMDGGRVPVTDVDEDTISRLRGLFDRGYDLVHAYATVLNVRECNPNKGWDVVIEHAHYIERRLGDRIEEASALLLQ